MEARSTLHMKTSSKTCVRIHKSSRRKPGPLQLSMEGLLAGSGSAERESMEGI